MYLTRWWLHFWFPPCPWQVYSFTLLPGLLSMRSKQSSSCQNSSFFVYMKNWEEKAHTEKIRIHDSYILKVAISRSKEKMRAISIIMLNLTFKRQTVFRFLSIKHPKDPNPKDPNIRTSEQCRVPSRKLSWNITQAFGLSFRWRIVFFLKAYQCILLQYHLPTNWHQDFTQKKSYESYNGIECLEVPLRKTKTLLGRWWDSVELRKPQISPYLIISHSVTHIHPKLSTWFISC